MEGLKTLVAKTQAGDRQAFEIIVRRFQDMAVGYGYALLGDRFLAEDAAQEAFINAYYDLPALRDPAAFPGWFRRIVFKHADRLRRGKRVATIPLSRVADAALPTQNTNPARAFQTREMHDEVFAAIETLPEPYRMVVTLYYSGDYSQKEISRFLEIPVTTVKSRLYAARKRLKERLMMVQEQLLQKRPSRDDTFTTSVMNLFQATKLGDISAVKTLLSRDPALVKANGIPDSPLWYSEAFPLHVAVMYGRKDIVDLLLASGADVKAKDSERNLTPLGWADLPLEDETDRSAVAALLREFGA